MAVKKTGGEDGKKALTSAILKDVDGYDKTIVGPVLDDYAQGKPFRPEDRHRLSILHGHLSASMGKAYDDWAKVGNTPRLGAEHHEGARQLMSALEAHGVGPRKNREQVARSPANELARNKLNLHGGDVHDAVNDLDRLTAKNGPSSNKAEKAGDMLLRASSIASLRKQSQQKAAADQKRVEQARTMGVTELGPGSGPITVKAHTDSKGRNYKEFTRNRPQGR